MASSIFNSSSNSINIVAHIFFEKDHIEKIHEKNIQIINKTKKYIDELNKFGNLSEEIKSIDNTNDYSKLFFSVWRNIFLKIKILSCIRVSGTMNRFLYDEINNPTWMARNNRFSLLYDKLMYTMVKDLSMFLVIVNNIDMFVVCSAAKKPGNDKLIEFFLETCQMLTLSIPNIIDLLAEGGYFEPIERIYLYMGDALWGNIVVSSNAIDKASENGHYNIVKLLLEKGEHFTDDSIINASKNGYINIVKLLVSKSIKPIPRKALSLAATNGHFKVLVILFFYSIGFVTAFNLYRYDNENFLKFPTRLIVDNSIFNKKSPTILSSATTKPATETATVVATTTTTTTNSTTSKKNKNKNNKNNNNNNNNNNNQANNNQANSNNNQANNNDQTNNNRPNNNPTNNNQTNSPFQVDLINRKALESQVSSTEAMNGALLNGHLDCVLFLEEFALQPFELTKELLREIACKGNLTILEYLRRKYVDLSGVFDAMCYSSKTFDFIKALFDSKNQDKFKITTQCFEYAAKGNQLTTFKFLVDKLILSTPPYFKKKQLLFMESLDYAAKHQNKEMMELICSNFKGVATFAVMNAIEGGSLQTLQWLYENRPEPLSTNALIKSIATGNLDLIKYVFQHSKEETIHHTKEAARAVGIKKVYSYVSLLSVHNQISKFLAREIISRFGANFREKFHMDYSGDNFKILHSCEITNITVFPPPNELKVEVKNKYEPVPIRNIITGEVEYHCPDLTWRITPDLLVISTSFNKTITIIDITVVDPLNAGVYDVKQVEGIDTNVKTKYEKLIESLKSGHYSNFDIAVIPLIIVNTFNAVNGEFCDKISRITSHIKKSQLELKIKNCYDVMDKDFYSPIPTDENFSNALDFNLTLQPATTIITPNNSNGASSIDNNTDDSEKKKESFKIVNHNYRENTILNVECVNNNGTAHIASSIAAPLSGDSADLVKNQIIKLSIKSDFLVHHIAISEKITCSCNSFALNSLHPKKLFCKHIKDLLTNRLSFSLKENDNQDLNFSSHFNSFKKKLC